MKRSNRANKNTAIKSVDKLLIRLSSIIDIKELLLRADGEALLTGIMEDKVITLNPDGTLEETAVLFAGY